jgi:Transglycosylase SLT domain
MGRLIWRRSMPRSASYGVLRLTRVRGAAGCAAVVLLAVGGGSSQIPASPGGSDRPAAAAAAAAIAQARAQTSFQQIIIPDLLVVAPAGLSSQQIAALSRISGVRNLIAFDGAQIKAGNHSVSVIGVNPSTFRSWVPLQTASNQTFWNALSAGQFVASPAATSSLSLRQGASYQLTGATRRTAKFGASAPLGIGQVDLLVGIRLSRQLGLVHSVAALISAPGLSTQTLTGDASAVLGPSGKIVDLRQEQVPAQSSPATPATPRTSGTPSTYLQLFQESAADYCPGLSWTVLAAIGQIESADGTNNGPSSAGALGPMQFLPSTWAVWGIDGFGQTGPPNIMNPYDAVPSAARMLCADGATAGGSGSLASAIFDYNHATWYVNEVLSLAAQYAQDY